MDKFFNQKHCDHCMEECRVDISDVIAASNPYSAPVRSSGEKHKKCYDCWVQYINGLVDKILKILEQAGYIQLQADDKGLVDIDLILKNSVVSAFKDGSEMNYRGVLTLVAKTQKALDDKEKEEAVKKYRDLIRRVLPHIYHAENCLDDRQNYLEAIMEQSKNDPTVIERKCNCGLEDLKQILEGLSK